MPPDYGWRSYKPARGPGVPWGSDQLIVACLHGSAYALKRFFIALTPLSGIERDKKAHTERRIYPRRVRPSIAVSKSSRRRSTSQIARKRLDFANVRVDPVDVYRRPAAIPR